MFAPHSSDVALPWLILPLVCWGTWPRLRTKCAASSAAFTILNVCGQVLAALLLAVIMGDIKGSAPFNDELLFLLPEWRDFGSLRHVAVLAGGFLLGHGDNIGSVAMQRVPAGVAFPLYAGTTTCIAQALNFAQLGSSSRLAETVVGTLLVLAAMVFLSLTQLMAKPGDEAPLPAAQSLRATLREPSGPGACGAAARDDDDDDHIEHTLSEAGQAGAGPQAPSSPLGGAGGGRAVRAQRRAALWVCFGAGVLSSGWSPLSTFALKGDKGVAPFITLLLFVGGEVAACPLVVLVTARLDRKPASGAWAELQALPARNIAWGLATGASIASGYWAYFAATAVIPSTITFGIISCCPLAALLLDVGWSDAFKGASPRVLAALALSVVTYCSAIAVLALASLA